jgi:hypothetical protein
MKKRVTWAVCVLDSYQKTTTWSARLKAFGATGFHPFSPEPVLGRPDVRQCDDDPETLMQLKHPDRAFTRSQELTSDMWAERVRARGGRNGRVSGEAEADTLSALGVVMGRDNLVRAAPGEGFRCHDSNPHQGCPPRPRRR